jgi:hypothetical protein
MALANTQRRKAQRNAKNLGFISPLASLRLGVLARKPKGASAGQTYYFCAPGCKKAFAEDPAKFLRADHKPSM